MGDMGARLGMLVVETIAKIRRAFFVQKKPIKAICREFRVSRKVVRKVIRSEATEFRYERGRQPLPRIDPWREQLDGLLLANEGKPARERLTLIRIFEELRSLGYEGSYDAVRRYAKGWRVARGAATAEAYVPLSFAPGEAYQLRAHFRHPHHQSGLWRLAQCVWRCQDDDGAPRSPDPSLRNHRNRQRELALQKPRLSATPACPDGQTGTSHARRSVAREGTTRRARGPPVRYRDKPVPTPVRGPFSMPIRGPDCVPFDTPGLSAGWYCLGHDRVRKIGK
jgi:hypothetical protein